MLILTGAWHAQRVSVWGTTEDPAFEWLGNWLPRTLGAARVYTRAEGSSLTAERARRRPSDQAFVDLTALSPSGPPLSFDSAGERRSSLGYERQPRTG